MKKGQSTLEYLITYGWAILIIVVIASVLWYFGVFNPSRWAGKQATGFSKFVVDDFAFSAGTGLDNGTLTMVMGSLNDKTITGVTITAEELNTGSPAVTGSISGSASWGPSDRKTVTFVNVTTSNATVGDDYRIKVMIAYNQGSVPHSDSGTLIGKVE